MHRYKAGEPWWVIDKALLAPVIAKRRMVDPIAEEIKNACAGRTYVSIVSLFKMLTAQDLLQKSLTPSVQARIEKALESAGFEETETVEGVMWKNPNPHAVS